MQLIPFDRAYAHDILSFYIDPTYAAFSRSIQRYPTWEECCNLPQFLGHEVLLVLDQNKLAGVILLLEESNKVFKWAIAISDRKKRIGSIVQDILESYLKNVRGARLIITEIIDSYLIRHLETTGYQKVGVIPGRDFVLGEYRDVTIYYKESSWVS